MLVSGHLQASRWAIVAIVFFLATSATAAPPGKPRGPGRETAKRACVAAHEEAQQLRFQKKLHAAREKYVACARDECPAVLREECMTQVEQVEAVAPTLTFEALDERGASDTNVKVTIDGELVAERLTGAALPVEPGEHVLRFERESDHEVIEQRVLVVEGEKNRKIVADFQTLAPKRPPSEPPPPPPARSTKIPPLAWVAGGVAVLGLGSFTAFALTGMSAEDDLAKGCAPRCAEDDVSSVKRSYAIADVSLAVGLVAAAAAVVLAVPALTSKPSAALGGKATALPWMPRTRTSR